MVHLTYCSISNIVRKSLAGLILMLGIAHADEREQVLTSIKPLALIASEITHGTAIKVGYLLSPSISEHNYALRMSDIKKLHEARLVIWLDDDIEPYLKSTRGSWMAADMPDKSLPLLEKIAPIQHKAGNNDKGTSDQTLEEHHHGTVDPHVWLNPLLARQLAIQMANRLGKIYPAYQPQFDANLRQFSQNVTSLDRRTAKVLEPYSKTPFFVHHNAYGYYVSQYGLNQLGVLRSQPEAAMSLKQLRVLQLAIQGQAEEVCLFREPQLAGIHSPTFSAGQVRSGELDPLGIGANSYSELIDNLTKGFLICFEQGEDKG